MHEVLYDSDPGKPVLVLQLDAPRNLRCMTKLSGRYYPSHRIS